MQHDARSLTPIIDLPFLAGEINDAHRQVAFHGKSMLLEAKRAGEALLAAKEKVRHGEFKAWIEANCRCGYRQAAKYMQVAKCAPQGTFDEGINAFLEAHATPRTKSAGIQSSAFTPTDAEHVLKLARMTNSPNEHEAEVAQRKLDEYAERIFGMTGEEALAKAEKMLPEPVALSVLERGIQTFMAPFERLPKHRLLGVILKCFAAHPDLYDMLQEELGR